MQKVTTQNFARYPSALISEFKPQSTLMASISTVCGEISAKPFEVSVYAAFAKYGKKTDDTLI